MDTLKREARVAGLFYLAIVITGPFILLFVPGKLFVAGDATATATNILAHQTLYRAWIGVSVVSQLAFVGTALALYRLLKRVNATYAAIMVLLVLLTAPAGFIDVANDVATLSLLRGGAFLSAFSDAQRNALATLAIIFQQKGVILWEVFWGLWLLPLAALVYRSGFIPRFIGVWLFVNGLTYVALSATGIWAPTYWRQASSYATPLLLGEVALMLWLVVVGARPGGASIVKRAA